MASSIQIDWKSKKGEKIHAQKWIIDGYPKAIIVLVHGLGEHIGRYEHVADYFNQNLVNVFGFDLRGHGKSSGKRGHIGSSEEFMVDIDTILKLVNQEFSNIPVFLYGHSMGGNMVLYYVLKRQPQIKGVISTSPGLGTGEPVPPAKLIAAKILKSIVPSMTMDNGLDVQNLSHNPQVIKNYQEDPLVHPMISAKLAMDLFANGDWILENAKDFRLPLLLLQGEKDHIVDLEKTKLFASKVSDKWITFKLLPDLYHELHNEYEQEQVFQFILDWILQHI